MHALDDALERLRRTKEHLPDALRAQLVAAGAAAVPHLLAILEDRDAWLDDAPGDGWPPIHAVAILGEIGDPRSVGPLIAATRDTGELDVLDNEIWLALPKHGAAALEPLLAAHDATSDEHERFAFTIVLSELGVRDDRIFTRLMDVFERDPEAGAGSLGEYGDPRALPHLQRRLDEHRVAAFDTTGNRAVIELAGAIESLDGELTVEQRNKLTAVRRMAVDAQRKRPSASDRPMPARRRERPGRNEPCWCGSGKKYKRCHLDDDERSEREAESVAERDVSSTVSAALLDVAGPLLDDAGDDAELQQEAIDTAAMAWNLCVVEAHGEPGALARALARMPASAERDELESLLTLLMARKRQLHPDDDRLVEDATIVDGPDGPELIVKSS
jgi:hypothetical protein